VRERERRGRRRRRDELICLVREMSRKREGAKIKIRDRGVDQHIKINGNKRERGRESERA